MEINLKKLPVDVGVVYEGERIRGPDTYVELGGPKIEFKAELALVRSEKEIEDSKITLIGKDIPDFNEGDKTPFGILVEIYGKKVERDLEGVIERRLHDFLNYIQGFMHLNQRYDVWCRVSKEAKEKGLTFEDIGKAIIWLFKEELPFIEKIQITFMTDELEVKKHHETAVELYAKRDARIRGIKDAEVGEFYGCSLCQGFAPNHICVISPQRISLCGSISWLDARAAARLDPDGPNFAIPKGELLDEKNGEYSGVNEIVNEYSNGANERFYLYSMFKYPHTSCGCFEAIAFYIPEVEGIGIIDRNFSGEAINGLKFSTMAIQSGGGEQVEGFLGMGIEWMHSPKFFSGDGGWNRIVWMPSYLKERMKEVIPGELYEKIPTEEDIENLEGLQAFLRDKNHPVVGIWIEAVEEKEIEGGIVPEIISPELALSTEEGLTIILKNARIYAETVIVRRHKVVRSTGDLRNARICAGKVIVKKADGAGKVIVKKADGAGKVIVKKADEEKANER